MAKDKPQKPEVQGAPTGATFSIQRIYVKDLSFESPLAPDVFTSQEWKPEINMDLHTNAKKLNDELHEVVLKLTVTAKHQGKTAFITEVQHAGIFMLKGFEAPQLSHVLGSMCPNIIYPFAREVIARTVADGGFPQLLLAPVNFEALYAQHLKQQAEGKLSETEKNTKQA